MPDTIGLIAGSRSLPLIFARQARALGARRIIAVAFDNETDPTIAPLVDAITWVRVGQLSKMIEGLTQHGVQKCVMLGQIAPRNLFDLRPDLRAVKVMFGLKEKNAHTIFGAIAKELQKDGVELVPAGPWLQALMPGAGFSFGAKLTEEQKTDIAFGFELAKDVSRLEIGQTVVVKNGTVLAVEAFEGTDACLKRGGELAGKSGGAVAVKAAKAQHDVRFDVPCLGLSTIESCRAAGIAVLAFEAGKTLLLDQEEMVAAAERAKIAVVAVS